MLPSVFSFPVSNTLVHPACRALCIFQNSILRWFVLRAWESRPAASGLRWFSLPVWESSPKTHRTEKMQRAANVMKIKGGEGAHVFMRWETFKTYRTELRSGSCRSLSGGFDAPPSIGVGTNF